MTTYRAKQQAPTWKDFDIAKGVLSNQLKGIPQGGIIQASIVGTQTTTGDTVLKVNDDLFVKSKFFEIVPTPEPTEPPPPVVAPPPPVSGEWGRYQVLHDLKSPLTENHAPYSARILPPNTKGAPEVNRIGSFRDHTSQNKVPLTPSRQFFWAGLLAVQVYGKTYDDCNPAEQKYIGKRLGALMGHKLAFTNSSQDGANYVAKENLDRPHLSMAALICGGCTIWAKPAGTNNKGVEMALIYSFLANDPLPAVMPLLLFHPRVLWATNVFSGGSVDPFGHLRGLSVPYPLFTAEPYYYPLAGLEEYSFDEPFRSQYLPEREYYP